MEETAREISLSTMDTETDLISLPIRVNVFI